MIQLGGDARRGGGPGEGFGVFVGRTLGASSPFRIATMPLDKALGYIATELVFWIHA
jgi:hypothetical protein